VAAARRTHFARILLDTTKLPMTEVALASGFRSVRQFNEVVRAVFRRTPTQLRKSKRDHVLSRGEVVLRLSFRSPFEWEPLLAFLAARAIPGVERVEEGRYRRTFGNEKHPAVLEAALAKDGRAVELRIRGVESAQLLDIVRRVRRLFDLDADPLAIISSLGASRLLAHSVAARPGLRVPGAWNRFETVVRAVLGQQISVAAATTLCARLVQRFGLPIGLGGGDQHLTHLFPTPEVLAMADLTTIGLPRFRAETLRNVAATVAEAPALLDPGPSLDQLIERLCALPGIGAWTAHYVAMRAFSEPDAFPSGDLILRRAAGDISAKELETQSQAWRPWRAYAVMHLWSKYSEEVSLVDRALTS
jgi:AraC family transcriptional regulator of adaptative response / DNA-3-methyladenine glycosylase II